MKKVIFAFLLLLASCDPDIDLKGKEAGDFVDNCVKAQKHLSECFGLEMTPLGECDNEAAEVIISKSCNALTSLEEEKKADGESWLDKMHCKIGVLHFCSAPTCLEEPVNSSLCLDAIDSNSCGQCSYYNCLESKAECGEEGYLIDFVGKYCNRFTQITYPRLSEFGKVWMNSVRECLIYNMDSEYYEGESCESIEDRGIKDHISCYTNSGICSLPASDWIKIVSTIKPGEFPLMQAIAVGNKCIKDFLNL